MFPATLQQARMGWLGARAGIAWLQPLLKLAPASLVPSAHHPTPPHPGPRTKAPDSDHQIPGGWAVPSAGGGWEFEDTGPCCWLTQGSTLCPETGAFHPRHTISQNISAGSWEYWAPFYR